VTELAVHIRDVSSTQTLSMSTSTTWRTCYAIGHSFSMRVFRAPQQRENI